MGVESGPFVQMLYLARWIAITGRYALLLQLNYIEFGLCYDAHVFTFPNNAFTLLVMSHNAPARGEEQLVGQCQPFSVVYLITVLLLPSSHHVT